MDEAQKLHPEMALRCADCGHTWRARHAQWCPRCSCKELTAYDLNWTPPKPAGS